MIRVRSLVLASSVIAAGCGPGLDRVWPQDNWHFAEAAAVTPDGSIRVVLRRIAMDKMLRSAREPGRWVDVVTVTGECSVLDQFGTFYRVKKTLETDGPLMRLDGTQWTDVSGAARFSSRDDAFGCLHARKLPSGETAMGPFFDPDSDALYLLMVSGSTVRELPLGPVLATAFALHVDGQGALWYLTHDPGSSPPATVVRRWTGEAWVAAPALAEGGDSFLPSGDGSVHVGSTVEAWELQEGAWVPWGLPGALPMGTRRCAVGTSGQRACLVDDLNGPGSSRLYREREGRWEKSDDLLVPVGAPRYLVVTAETLLVVGTHGEDRIEGHDPLFAGVVRLPW